MDNRELYKSTTGQMITVHDDSRIEDVLDEDYGYASDADYSRAASAFLADTERVMRTGSRKINNYDTETGKSALHHQEWYEILFAIGIAGSLRRRGVGPLCTEATDVTGKDKRMLRTLALLSA